MATDVTEVDLCFVRGDTAEWTITITSDGTTPIDITGFSFLLTVDPSAAPDDDTNNLFQLSVGSGLTLSDAANGEITVGITVVQADQTPSVYFYDLQQTDTGGLIKTVLKGQWQVIQDITK